MSRPGAPAQARRLQVQTNSFKITGLPKKNYYQYDAIKSADDSQDDNRRSLKEARRRIEVFERLQNRVQPAVFKPKVIYDSDAIAYSSHVLSFGNSATFDVNMSDRGPPTARNVWRVTLTRVNAADVDFNDLRRLINGESNQLTPKAAIALNLLQLIVRQAPNLKYANNVRAFFCREAGSRPLGGGLEIFKGFFQSVRPAFRSLLVNIDTSCGIIYQEGPMPEVVLSFLGTSDSRALRIDESHLDWPRLKRFFKSIFITFTHRKGKKKINGLVPRAGRVEFEREKDGVVKKTTVQAYFKEAYNVNINPDSFGVEIGRGTVVPVELCVIEPNQRFTRKLPQELTKKMVEFTSEKPKARLGAIERGIRGTGGASVLDYMNSPFVLDAELEISPTPTIIDGKVLTTPPMQYAGPQPLIPKFGAWNAVNQRFYKPKSINRWVVVDYSNTRDRQANERFVKMLGENCQKLGMTVNPPSGYIQGNGNNVVADLKQAARQATGQDGVQPDMILVILPPSAAEIRFAVKQHGDVLHGVVTQCVRVDKIARANDQYCNNVAMKINPKLGGVNAVPQSKVLAELKKAPFIIMGADVGHPSPGVTDQPSVASLVWSYDPDAMRYEAFTAVQPPRLETIENLHGMVKQAINDFGQPPSRIVFFRDGLSESEYAKVAEKEIQDIKGAVDAIWQEKGVGKPKPTLTFIVVGKRHHVRFFPKSDQDADKSGNCPAGFVADQGIGNPIAKDYYLQSHGGLLGTSRPSHYVVIRDENFANNIDSLQELSFVLCHSYARATRSVSIPAPVYYADLVCSRANFHFNPLLRYDDSAASVSSGGSTFNIRKWQEGFKGPHKNLLRKMFYM
ncbi:hypothetical protein HYDPIDRAFT_43184 [Hydnomerulius pinastri MD-312]|uniref:Unplaced genomic scaffold scaffold_36, whole genome shotgun sequence n=1 Tax=Hydnomerulius pinastri MD-312 TaxID=994086 RepID=A0A0C9WBB2_9AGAM|nr:hypothetical protein HYDPIDRAFT_43184 [Hydnomerulius pinastri MD-312]